MTLAAVLACAWVAAVWMVLRLMTINGRDG